MKSETIQVRVDPMAKARAAAILNELGISMSEAVNAFLHQLILRNGFPFDLVVPSNRTVNDKRALCTTLEQIVEAVKGPCDAYGVEKLVLFGSRARGEARADSDYDFRLDRGSLRGMDFFALKCDLEQVLGAKVDLVTTESLSEDFAARIAGDEVVVYEACYSR